MIMSKRAPNVVIVQVGILVLGLASVGRSQTQVPDNPPSDKPFEKIVEGTHFAPPTASPSEAPSGDKGISESGATTPAKPAPAMAGKTFSGKFKTAAKDGAPEF